MLYIEYLFAAFLFFLSDANWVWRVWRPTESTTFTRLAGQRPWLQFSTPQLVEPFKQPCPMWHWRSKKQQKITNRCWILWIFWYGFHSGFFFNAVHLNLNSCSAMVSYRLFHRKKRSNMTFKYTVRKKNMISLWFFSSNQQWDDMGWNGYEMAMDVFFTPPFVG